MSEVICLASAKGGSGKTVLTATFGTLLASLGKSVLLIDTDAATNGLTLLYLKDVAEKERRNRGVTGLFETNSSDADEELDVVQIAAGLSLFPATYHFRDTEITNVATFERRLLHIVSRARESFDYIFLDAQAGADEYARRALSSSVSDKVVIVSEYDPTSAAGIERLKALFVEDLAYQRTWILLNKVLPEFAKSFSEFLEVARYLSPVPWLAGVVRAFARRSLALDLENGNTYTLAIVQSLRVLLPECKDDFDSWLSTRSGFLKKSLNEQIDRAETDLASIERALHYETQQRQFRKRSRILRKIILVSLLTGISLILISLLDANPTLQVVLLTATSAIISSVLFFQFQASSMTLDEKPSVEARLQTRRLEERLQELYTLRDLGERELIEQRYIIDQKASD